ncbi:hypothetical protein PFISCL1PPCAC_2688, partial [Pristionchus fissidentatus]
TTIIIITIATATLVLLVGTAEAAQAVAAVDTAAVGGVSIEWSGDVCPLNITIGSGECGGRGITAIGTGDR